MNRQPVFTDIPILVSKTFDPPINIDSTNLGSLPPTSIFTSTDVSGSLIERVTVSATCDTTYNYRTSNKLIYLCIYDNNSTTWSLYKTANMPYTAIDNSTTINPEIEWVFTGGLLLPNGFELGIAASTNKGSTGQFGDYLSVTVEGSSYTSV
jgi:hypothetical protein